jgi:putative acetyltransferase
VTANSGGDIEVVQALWREYWASMGLPDDFQGFASEVASLPGLYRRLLIERVDGIAAGTVSLRSLGETACEVKRLYVRPAYRGLGIGRRLMENVIGEARRLGYERMYADTLPAMSSALAMYKEMGFVEVGPYSENPTPGAIFLQFAL